MKTGQKRIAHTFLRLLGAVCLFGIWKLSVPFAVHASEDIGYMNQYPGVRVSVTGTSWTTDYMDRTAERREYGYTVETGISSGIRALEPGEHYYRTPVTGQLHIGRWVVQNPNAACIHEEPYIGDWYEGYRIEHTVCYNRYNNGWIAYCADCGEPVADVLIYAAADTVAGILTMPAASTYLYICPYCHSLEQGTAYQHVCKAISYNHYTIRYMANEPEACTVSGYMAPTGHMYNNAGRYEGIPVEELSYGDTRLRRNSFSCPGFLFAGWNTEADGSGIWYQDGQEIWNLSEQEGGIVTLYAQWKRASSTLYVDAGGGHYSGERIFAITQGYGTRYEVDNGLVIPPEGYTVAFDSRGGENVETMLSEKVLVGWDFIYGSSGSFQGQTYTFSGEEGSSAVIKALYGNPCVLLPTAEREGYLFAGWYADEACKELVGEAGEEYVPDQNITLYAGWSVLYLKASEKYTLDSYKGAVDLEWTFSERKAVYYKLYQSEDGENWTAVHHASLLDSAYSLLETVQFQPQGKTFEIESGGWYSLQAYGGKGADYGAFSGGLGGKVSACYWLKQGDAVTVYAGRAGAGSQGGQNARTQDTNAPDGGASDSAYGAGGGAATVITLTRDGRETILLLAGGGGGANGVYPGGAGGSVLNAAAGQAGEQGAGGGGGGRTGGKGGSRHIHVHTGSDRAYGGCYQKAVYCEVADFDVYTKIIDSGWYDALSSSHIAYDENGVLYCTRDGRYDPHQDYWEVSQTFYVCKRCGTEYADRPSICTNILRYERTCKDPAPVFTPSSGGSSYINPGFGCRNPENIAGICADNGYGVIGSRLTGFLEVCALEHVTAPDKAAPNQVIADIQLYDKDQIKVSWEKPEDNGSLYYHKVESYSQEDMRFLMESNITVSRLTTGVAGYYYYIDSVLEGTVTDAHRFLEDTFLCIAREPEKQYLHIAAVDAAGNVGTTTNIFLDFEEEAAYPDANYTQKYLPETTPLLLWETEGVYRVPDGDGLYYLRSDGQTIYTLQEQAGIRDAMGLPSYQVDTVRTDIRNIEQDSNAYLSVTVPRTVKAETFENHALQTDGQGLVSFVPDSIDASRDAGLDVTVRQYMTLSVHADGQTFVLTPKAAADRPEEGKDRITIYSDAQEDALHGITVIGDGTPPVIYGADTLLQAGILDVTQESKSFTITAKDTGSGLSSIEVLIYNRDNQMRQSFLSYTDSVTVTVSGDDALFMGDFECLFIAVDRVGNVSMEGEEGLAFSLKAVLEKADGNDVKCDSVYLAGTECMLTVMTGGYAEKVTVTFPEEILALTEDLNRVYEYEIPEIYKTEVQKFRLPYRLDEGSYSIVVEAYKGGRRLTERVLLVVTESIIPEALHTRIRDNGV